MATKLRDRLEGDTAHLSETTGPLPRNCRWTVMISHLVSVSLWFESECRPVQTVGNKQKTSRAVNLSFSFRTPSIHTTAETTRRLLRLPKAFKQTSQRNSQEIIIIMQSSIFWTVCLSLYFFIIDLYTKKKELINGH